MPITVGKPLTRSTRSPPRFYVFRVFASSDTLRFGELVSRTGCGSCSQFVTFGALFLIQALCRLGARSLCLQRSTPRRDPALRPDGL